MEIVPARVFAPLYIVFDCIFLISLAVMLLLSRRRRALVFGLLGGVLYFIVDYGIFYLALHARVVTGAPTALFLFWLSMSYGFTNFAWIYLMLSRDKYRKEWSVFIFFSWITVALLAENFGGEATISIYRTTTGYHGVMALILVIGYAIVICLNIFRDAKIDIFYLLFVGITVQLGWESALLITGIRQSGLETLIINSLIETNLGLPYIYFIHKAVEDRLGPERQL